MIKRLIKKKKTIATAESCTGGMIAARITAEAGASACFPMGVVTYSNESKMQLLDVKEQTLKEHGAVSYQTALEMSEGILKLSGADIGLSVTGIAGPGGGSVEKPVGLIYLSLCAENYHQYKELHLSGDRDSIRSQTVEAALEMVLTYLENS